MNTQNTLDVSGSLSRFPFAELLVELKQTHLDGSLRLARDAEKVIIYLKSGEVIFGVSNLREHRLLQILLREKMLQLPIDQKYARAANDMELSASLMQDGLLTQVDADAAAAAQIESIIIDTLGWPDGEWQFNPLARARADLHVPVDLDGLLMNYARCVSINVVIERFKSVAEAFSIVPGKAETAGLLAHEAYLLTRFGENPLKIGDLRNLCTLPEDGMLHTLYVLWLGGIIKRHDWNAAISSVRLAQISAAKLSLVKAAADPAASQDVSKPETQAEPEKEPVETSDAAAISLEEYLKRSETANDLYETLGLPRNTSADLIKDRYFGLAKQFHPDRYHREKPETRRRIQNAFSRIAQAYETLKASDSRETYDYKLKREDEIRSRRREAGLAEELAPEDIRIESGRENFEQGLRMFEEKEFASAIALFARAVHYSPDNALYRAHYGRALSIDTKQRHKAESELQAAAKAEPANAEIRFMLVDFYLAVKLTKRAEGELIRFLEIAPGNAQAVERLRRIQS
ncbi:MAG TPA: hypothetical protein DEA22_06805 [Blastocatellia bacterium]|nr:hypothetical protein [Blastocatellia bacterium]